MLAKICYKTISLFLFLALLAQACTDGNKAQKYLQEVCQYQSFAGLHLPADLPEHDLPFSALPDRTVYLKFIDPTTFSIQYDNTINVQSYSVTTLAKDLRQAKKKNAFREQMHNLAIALPKDFPVSITEQLFKLAERLAFKKLILIFWPEKPIPPPKTLDKETERIIMLAHQETRPQTVAKQFEKAITFCPSLENGLAALASADSQKRCALMYNAAPDLFAWYCIVDDDAFLTAAKQLWTPKRIPVTYNLQLKQKSEQTTLPQAENWGKLSHALISAGIKNIWLDIPEGVEQAPQSTAIKAPKPPTRNKK